MDLDAFNDEAGVSQKCVNISTEDRKNCILPENLFTHRKRDPTMKMKEEIPLKQIKINAYCLCFNSKKT